MNELEKLEKELLQEIQEEPQIYADTDEFCTIDPETRIIIVPPSKRTLGTESDQETNRLYFKCPKMVGDNVDLSLFSLRINYQNAGNKKDRYLVEDVKEEGDTITFSWLLKRNVTAYKGNVKFILCAVKTTEDGAIKNEWNTTLNDECECLEGMEVDQTAVEEETKDIVEQLITMMNHSAENAVRAVEAAKAEVDKEVGDFDLKAQQALADVNNAGQTQTERVQSAGTTAVENIRTVQGTATEAVETAKSEAVQAIQAEGTTQTGNVTTEGTKQVQAVADKGKEVLQSIPEDFQTAMDGKLDKNQGIEYAGKALVIGEDGNVIPGEVQGGTVDLDTTLTQPGKAADAKATGDRILQFAIKNTMQGESPLVVPDSAEEPVLGLRLTGKTEQFTTTGAQLVNPVEMRIGTIAEDTGNDLGLKQYVTTGYIPVSSGKKYATGFGSNFSFHAGCLYDSEKQKTNALANLSSVIPEGSVFLRISYAKKDGSDVTESDLEEFKKVLIINEGTAPVPYEPYTGGKPSPSIEFPQEIVTAGKWNEDTQKYEVGVKVAGKNFLTDNYEQYTDGKYKQKVALPAGNYIYTCERNNNIWLLHEDGSNITNGWMATNKFNFSLTKKETIELRIETKNPAGNNHMIRLQGSDDVYVPYREPQSLTLTSDRPITKWDKLVEQDGRIGWLYKSNKYVVTGEEALLTNAAYPKEESVNYYFINNSMLLKRDALANFCDKLTFIDAVWLKNVSSGFGVSNNQLHIRLPLEIIGATKEDDNNVIKSKFAEYLSQKHKEGDPYIFYSEAIEAEFIPLPQDQQDAIRALVTYYPTTVITTDGGELNPDVELEYVADSKNYVDNKIAEIAKKQLATDALILERTV